MGEACASYFNFLCRVADSAHGHQSAAMLTAISSGESAPISSPIGDYARDSSGL